MSPSEVSNEILGRETLRQFLARQVLRAGLSDLLLIGPSERMSSYGRARERRSMRLSAARHQRAGRGVGDEGQFQQVLPMFPV